VRKHLITAIGVLAVFLRLFFFPPQLHAQGGAQPPPQAAAPLPARAAAPWDMTGYWVALITDDWRYRMLTPPKGNVDYLPVTAEARQAANAWDPAKDEANGDQCKVYGAGGIMRLPGRLHVEWENENTLKMDIDAGTQTRRFVFGGPPQAGQPATWQGNSVARWEFPGVAGRGFFGGNPNAMPATGPRPAQLKVTTTGLRPGYVRKNGIPYGPDTVITEYFVHLVDVDRQEYLALTTMVDDPRFFQPPYIKTYEFKKQKDGQGWNPTPCSAR
jgi:hypothetical protein